MGNLKGKNEIAKTEAPEFIRTDQMDSAAKIWYGNMLAVIKLRKKGKGATNVSKLP